MAFDYALHDARGDQDYGWMQRFDPRFWTVNFPRPMMASVVTTAPDALRVDLVAYTKDTLVGLIWDSADSLDHPLLAYETRTDYRRCTLSFRWRSSGLIGLDAVNGPTLTIEGFDEADAPRAWYVRLWNYAAGTPEDAVITLPFSSLDGGFLLPSEADPVFAGNITRMFISLPQTGYDPAGGSLPTPQEAWAELSGMSCDGEGAMLKLGDIMLPPHGAAMATGYDDSYNQTPARLLRAIRALGYRGSINHYVGMSHYFRLDAGGNEVTTAGGALNAPCAAWHADFLNRAGTMGFSPIVSLSYELFDAHCPEDWKQRAANGDPALTGWVPPSTLLSPANAQAMAYLQDVARAFVALMQGAGVPVRFQVGEPWWWVMPDRRICLYDDAANAAFGALSVPIDDVAAPMSAAQTDMLDAAGTLLAASTAALADAVRDEVETQGAELLLLIYLPTIIDAASPEVRRANAPIEWAYPAFDVLQLEDYDWAATGNFAAHDRALVECDARFGYSQDRQHYMAGFVLNAEDADQWRNIVAAANRVAPRGPAETLFWALPQVARDGFTLFNLSTQEDSDMQAFDDAIFPLALSKEALVATEFSTQVFTAVSGHETRNSTWADARMAYDIGPGLRSEDDVRTLAAFFRARRGAARAFRFRDPFDNGSSGQSAETVTPTDQPLGTGDGVTTGFPLFKFYGEEEPQPRRITRPIPGSVRVAVDGVETAAFTLGALGEVQFAEPPAMGASLTSGFAFHVPVRFGEDRLDLAAIAPNAGEISSVRLIEVREG